MAQLTQLDSKVADVLGLAQAAQQATRKVARLERRRGPHRAARAIARGGGETERRCKATAERREDPDEPE